VTPQQLLLEWVATPSLSKEEQELANLAQKHLQELGLQVSRVGNNLIAKKGYGTTKLLLASHLDTVPVGEYWTSAPYPTAWEGEKLIGRGSNDAKGCAAAMTWAVAQSEVPENCELILLLAAEEEIGGANGIQMALAELLGISAAIVGEPTSCKVCDAQRGMVILKLIATGTPQHAANATLPNAIHQAAEDITFLNTLEFPAHPRLGSTKPQTTTIQGGTTRNMTPGSCEFFVDFRTTPGLTCEAILKQLEPTVKSSIIVHSDRYPAKSTPENHPILLAALEGSNTTEPIGSNTVSDWAFLGDIPAVKLGPGDTHRSHTPNEFLLESEFLQGIQTYTKTIECYWRLMKNV
jgi:acetylornithine deacetylase